MELPCFQWILPVESLWVERLGQTIDYIFKIWNPSGLPISPHLRRQMPSRIGDYSEKTSSLYLRQPRQLLNLGNSANIWRISYID